MPLPNKSALVAKLTKKLSVTSKEANLIIDAFTSSISECLTEGDGVSIKNFGTFKKKVRKGRVYCLPSSGEKVEIKDKEYVHFGQSPNFYKSASSTSNLKTFSVKPFSLVKANFTFGSFITKIEPLDAVEKRHIQHALKSCDGNVRYASKLLGIGRATLYRKVEQYSKETNTLPCTPDTPWATPGPDLGKLTSGRTKQPLLNNRRKVERAIERSGGILKDAAAFLDISYSYLLYNLNAWSKDNEDLINSKAKEEGITKEEIDVIFKRMSVNEYAKLCDCSPVTAYKLIDQALDILGLCRYKQWLFLKP